MDFSLKTLTEISHEVYTDIHQHYPEHTIVLVGHSLGGTIATKLAKRISEEGGELARVMAGLIVIDVAEGSAKDALPFMKAFIDKQQKQFKRVEDAIQYMYLTQQIRNKRSACVTVPDQLVPN